MDFATSLTEMAATIIEGILIFASLSKMCSQSKEVTGRTLAHIAVGTALFSFIVIVFNSLQAFSFLTISLSILLTVVLSKIFFQKTLLFCSLGTMITFLMIHSVDYILSFCLGMVFENPIHNVYSFSEMMNPGAIRTFYLILDKGTDVCLFFLLRKHMGKLQSLKRGYQIILLSISSLVYIIMSVMLSLIISDSMIAMQVSVMVAWMFLTLFVFIVMTILLISSEYQKEMEAYRLLQTTNSMMEENYRKLHSMQNKLSKRNHDINNHLEILLELVKQNKTGDIESYIVSLLEVTHNKAAMCHSGNDVIDAIINTKLAEAKDAEIDFQFQANFSVPTNIAATDICAVLANQIDNAFEACNLIQDESKRYVRVHIWQKSGNQAIFQVSNRVARNPFENNENLQSTKTDKSRPHGLGIRSIRDTAEKYGGTLKNIYQDGEFISIALLNFQVF